MNFYNFFYEVLNFWKNFRILDDVKFVYQIGNHIWERGRGRPASTFNNACQHVEPLNMIET